MKDDRQARRSALDERIDELYQRPAGEFTASRNALAKTLAGADAARVKRLTKPTVIPWAINQVYWAARSVYDRLLAAGSAVRRAQIAALEKPGTTVARTQKSREQVRQAIDAHRQAVADAVHQALRAAAKFDAHPPVDALTRMLESLSLAPEHPSTPGRLTELVQPAGFEALTGVTPALSFDVPAPGGAESPAPATRSAPPPDRTAVQAEGSTATSGRAPRARGAQKREAAAAKRARQLAIESARRELAKAREREQRTRAQAERAEHAVIQAERALEATRQALDDARKALDEAERARRAAEAAVPGPIAG